MAARSCGVAVINSGRKVSYMPPATEIRNGCAAHASSCQDDHALTHVAREVRRDTFDVSACEAHRGDGAGGANDEK